MSEIREIQFVSLGMVVIDEIRIPGKEPITESAGGSGLFSTLGARLFLPQPESRSVAFTIRAGDDFPHTVRKELELWDTSLQWIEEKGQLSTRGLLTYEDDTFGPKSFRYTTPRLLISPKHLGASAVASKAFHFLCSPEDLEADVDHLLKIRWDAGISRRPIILWEPAPLSCTNENLEACMRSARIVDIFSPNHIELAKLCGASEQLDRKNFEDLISRFSKNGIGSDGKGSIVIRAGENGQVVGSRNSPTIFSPPFHSNKKDQPSKVIDTTGAGNAFLGGYAIGLLESKSTVEAAYFGAVAASVVIEKLGIPSMTVVEGQEYWGGVNVRSRLEEYRIIAQGP